MRLTCRIRSRQRHILKSRVAGSPFAIQAGDVAAVFQAEPVEIDSFDMDGPEFVNRSRWQELCAKIANQWCVAERAAASEQILLWNFDLTPVLVGRAHRAVESGQVATKLTV